MITSINELEKILRNALILQSELDGKYVRNSLSLYGEDLQKMLEEQIFSSITQSDSLILFELRSRDNQSDMSETENDETISYYKSYLLFVTIYGDDSSNIANKIISRFRTEKNRLDLQNKDVYLESISNATRINEFVNQTMWIRNDIEIDISCKLTINQIEQDYQFDNIKQINIKEVNT